MKILLICLFVLGTAARGEGLSAQSPVPPEMGDNPVVLPAPPFQALRAPASVPVAPLSLRILTSKPNGITDEDEWFEKNGLTLSKCAALEAPRHKNYCGGQIPPTYKDAKFVGGIEQKPYYFLFYGKNFASRRYLAIADSDLTRVETVLDFVNYANPPGYNDQGDGFTFEEPVWVARRDDVLYVSNAHRGYASTTKGMNAYISAIDLKSRKLLWRSSPLVSNSYNFEIIGDTIVTGYGFTAEPHFLYGINRLTGETVQKLKVAKSPEYIVRKGGKLYVRTYSFDYTLAFSPPNTKVSAADANNSRTIHLYRRSIFGNEKAKYDSDIRMTVTPASLSSEGASLTGDSH